MTLMSFEDQRLKFLRDIPIFAGVDIAAFEELASGMTEAAFESGEMVFREKDPGGEMFIIHSGAVEIIKHFGDKHETNLAVLGPRDFFGEMAIIESGARSATARSVKLTRLFCIKAEQLNRLFQRHPAQYAIIILNIARNVSRRLRALGENWSEVSRWGSLDEAMLRAMDA